MRVGSLLLFASLFTALDALRKGPRLSKFDVLDNAALTNPR
jgi:hypothetical protein